MAGSVIVTSLSLTATIEYPGSQHFCCSTTHCNWQLVHLRGARPIGGDQLHRGCRPLGRCFSAQHECVKDILALITGRDIWKDRSTCANGRAGNRSFAGAVEEADLHVQTPVLAPWGVSTEALALCSFVDFIEVANFRLGLTGHFLELVTASFFYGGSFWAGDDESAVRGVGAAC